MEAPLVATLFCAREHSPVGNGAAPINSTHPFPFVLQRICYWMRGCHFCTCSGTTVAQPIFKRYVAQTIDPFCGQQQLALCCCNLPPVNFDRISCTPFRVQFLCGLAFCFLAPHRFAFYLCGWHAEPLLGCFLCLVHRKRAEGLHVSRFGCNWSVLFGTGTNSSRHKEEGHRCPHAFHRLWGLFGLLHWRLRNGGGGWFRISCVSIVRQLCRMVSSTF